MANIVQRPVWFNGVQNPQIDRKKLEEDFGFLIKSIFDPQKAKGSSLSDKKVTEETPLLEEAKIEKPLDKKLAADFINAATNPGNALRKANVIASMKNPQKYANLGKAGNIQATALAGNLITGGIAIFDGHEQAKKSYAIGDRQGLTAGIVKTLRGPFEMISGGGFAVTSGISAVKSSQTMSSSLQKTMQVVGLASNAATGALFVAFLIPSIHNLSNTISFKHELDAKIKAGGNKAGFVHLRNSIKITNEDRKKILDEIFHKKEENLFLSAFKKFLSWIYADKSAEEAKKVLENFRTIISKEGLKKGGEVEKLLETVDPDKKLSSLIKQEDRRFALKYLDSLGQNFTPEEKQNLLTLISVFYKIGLDVTLKRKETELKKRIGDEAFEKVKQHLTTKIGEIEEKVINETVQAARKNIRKTIFLEIAVIVASVLGLVSTILGTLFTSGIMPLIGMILSITMTGFWIGVDGYTLYQDYKKKEAGFKDKVVMFLTTLALAGISTLGSAFAGGVGLIAITAVFTAGWMFYLLYIIYKWNSEKEKKEPSLAGSDSGIVAAT